MDNFILDSLDLTLRLELYGKNVVQDLQKMLVYHEYITEGNFEHADEFIQIYKKLVTDLESIEIKTENFRHKALEDFKYFYDEIYYSFCSDSNIYKNETVVKLVNEIIDIIKKTLNRNLLNENNILNNKAPSLSLIKKIFKVDIGNRLILEGKSIEYTDKNLYQAYADLINLWRYEPSWSDRGEQIINKRYEKRDKITIGVINYLNLFKNELLEDFNLMNDAEYQLFEAAKLTQNIGKAKNDEKSSRIISEIKDINNELRLEFLHRNILEIGNELKSSQNKIKASPKSQENILRAKSLIRTHKEIVCDDNIYFHSTNYINLSSIMENGIASRDWQDRKKINVTSGAGMADRTSSAVIYCESVLGLIKHCIWLLKEPQRFFAKDDFEKSKYKPFGALDIGILFKEYDSTVSNLFKKYNFNKNDLDKVFNSGTGVLPEEIVNWPLELRNELIELYRVAMGEMKTKLSTSSVIHICGRNYYTITEWGTDAIIIFKEESIPFRVPHTRNGLETVFFKRIPPSQFIGMASRNPTRPQIESCFQLGIPLYIIDASKKTY